MPENVFHIHKMNTKRKRQQGSSGSFVYCKKAKPDPDLQRNRKPVDPPELETKVKQQKKRKGSNNNQVPRREKLLKDKTLGEDTCKTKLHITSAPREEKKFQDALSGRTVTVQKSTAASSQSVTADSKAVTADSMAGGGTDSKKTGKKLNKWQRFKKKTDRIDEKDDKKKAKNVPLAAKTKGNNPTMGNVKPMDVSSNWKQLQQDLGIQTKRKNVNQKVTATKEESQEDKEPEIWFDDVDEILLDRKIKHTEKCTSTHNPLVKVDSYGGLTKVVAMDCEMVGVGREGRESMLARVSIVNQHGHCVYDHFVRPMEEVVDYRTKVSGVRKHNLENGKEFAVVQKEVGEILQGRILVGHAIQHDLQVLYIGHPKKEIRDTSRYKRFRQVTNGRTPSLKKLSAQVLGVSVQEGEHNSVQDAQATMRLYTMYRKQWEKEIKEKTKPGRKNKSHKKKKMDNKNLTDRKTRVVTRETVIPSSLLERD